MNEQGWIDWSGGECPVDPGTMVDVQFRDGGVSNRLAADGWIWEHGGRFTRQCDEIIAYRIVEPGK